jgi:LmbE family N-acetylglucosaminyl deacetylase
LIATDTRHADARSEASASVRITEETRAGEALGVPEPHLLSDPAGRWRSRMIDSRWEVNDAHPDYLALRNEPRARVRYLLALLAKEIVVRTTGRLDAQELLESLVEVLAHAERNLRGS